MIEPKDLIELKQHYKLCVAAVDVLLGTHPGIPESPPALPAPGSPLSAAARGDNGKPKPKPRTKPAGRAPRTRGRFTEAGLKLLTIIGELPKQFSNREVAEKSGADRKTVGNCIMRLKAKGAVESVSYGIWRKTALFTVPKHAQVAKDYSAFRSTVPAPPTPNSSLLTPHS